MTKSDVGTVRASKCPRILSGCDRVAMTTSIEHLPNEILQQIILWLPPRNLPSFQRSCRRFNDLVGPLIWRQFCRQTYRYWHPEHHIKSKFRDEVEATDWKALFLERQYVDRQTNCTIDSVLASQVGRINKFRRIIDYGYDAKDSLLRQCKAPVDVDDGLARRYYSHAILSCIHRKAAIEEWASDSVADLCNLERCIWAFDAFVIGDQNGDFDEIAGVLDHITWRILQQFPGLMYNPIRQRAILINRCLRDWQYIGVYADAQKDCLWNHFLGIALVSNDHCSSTLVSTVIFCCVAQRLGIDAAPGTFPLQVLAVIKALPGSNLEGDIATPESQSVMYLNPSVSDEEIPVDDLAAQLHALGVPQQSHQALLETANHSEIILRAARNIYHSVHENHTAPYVGRYEHIHNTTEHEMLFPDLEGSLYSALWALILLGDSSHGESSSVAIRRRNCLPHLVEQFETNFPSDIDLIEHHLLPLFQNTGEQVQLRESIRVIRSVDSIPKETKTRKDIATGRVKYKIGQVFTHRRYHYQAVITGWDAECAAHETWITQMRVNELSKGRQQSFYHVLVEDKSIRYVAEENIVPSYPDFPSSLIPIAGRHFKRWDVQNRCFISNIIDEYPDG